MNLLELQRSTRRLRKTILPIQQNKVSITRMTLNTDDLQLLIAGQVIGTTATYDVVVQFQQIQVNPVLLSDTVEIHAPKTANAEETTILIRKLRKGRTPVKISCLCPDYQFSFSYPNNKVQSHYGELPTYIRKTIDHAKRNPLGIPGMCRHLYAFIELLRKEGILST